MTEAITRGIKKVFPECEINGIPMADGGEGTVEALTKVMGGEYVRCLVDGPLRNPVQATYGWIEKEKMAVIEMSAASGLTLIPYAEGNVMRTTTFGTGQLIKDALQRGCRHVLLGIGGSATNDAGVGMLQALGFRFLDKSGCDVCDGGENLLHIAKIDSSHAIPELENCVFDVATDVRNPFYGKSGAAHVFAPQKGANSDQVYTLDDGLKSFASLILKDYGLDLQNIPGAGAAGGLGGGCAALLKARLSSGVELIKEVLHFDQRIIGADFIITGEGKVDGQTLQGKVVSGVLDSARKNQIPLIVLSGNCQEKNEILEEDPLVSLFSIHFSPVSLAEAMKSEYTREQVERISLMIFKMLKNNNKFADKFRLC